MSQDESQKKIENKEKQIEIDESGQFNENIIAKKEEKCESSFDCFISDVIKDFKKEIIEESSDDIKNNSQMKSKLKDLEKCFEEIKKNQELDLDLYIKEIILDLEEFVGILTFEDLITEPKYTFKLFMNCLKKVISFKYFYRKFVIPKSKTNSETGKNKVREYKIVIQNDKLNSNEIKNEFKKGINRKSKKKINKEKKGNENAEKEKDQLKENFKKIDGKKRKQEEYIEDDINNNNIKQEKYKEDDNIKEEEYKEDDISNDNIQEEEYIEDDINNDNTKEEDHKEEKGEGQNNEENQDNQFKEKEDVQRKEIQNEKAEYKEENKKDENDNDKILNEEKKIENKENANQQKGDEEVKQKKEGIKVRKSKNELILKKEDNQIDKNIKITYNKKKIKPEAYDEKEDSKIKILKNEFLNKLKERELKGKFSNKINENIIQEEENNKNFIINQSSKISNNKTSLSENISKYNNIKSTENNEIKDSTEAKLKEYKAMNYDNILSIINNNANVDEDDFIEGKTYESKVKKYFKVALDICSKKTYNVYTNSTKSIQSFYKFYEDLIQKDISKKDSNILGNSQQKDEYNKIEFDVMVNDVSAKTIKKFINVFKSSIIAKNFNENTKESTKYQIVGEVAKNILNQSIDKNKQIGKIMEEFLTVEETTKSGINLINGIILEYNNLKLDLQQKKIIFIFTNGSLIELKKAVLFNETDFEKSKNDYESLDIKSIFPIINKNRYGKNIFYLKKLIDKLNKSQIPFIIFYIGEELNNGIDNIIINHIKKFKNRPEYKSIVENIVKKEEQISNNISQSYILRTVNKNLKQINKNKIFNMIKDICNSVSSEVVLEYHKFLYDNLISQKEIEAKFNILIFSVIPKDYLSYFEKKLNSITLKKVQLTLT